MTHLDRSIRSSQRHPVTCGVSQYHQYRRLYEAQSKGARHMLGRPGERLFYHPRNKERDPLLPLLYLRSGRPSGHPGGLGQLCHDRSTTNNLGFYGFHFRAQRKLRPAIGEDALSNQLGMLTKSDVCHYPECSPDQYQQTAKQNEPSIRGEYLLH